MKTKNLWVTWEDHRRSRELAAAFNCDYVCFASRRNRFLRYIFLSFKTITFINKFKPSVVFCQNPSIVLAFLLCTAKFFFRYQLIVDRHSSFKFSTRGSWHPMWLIFHKISDFSLKNADITIVTNKYLQDFVQAKGGRAFVLPDKIPQLYPSIDKAEDEKKTITFVSTFSDDEPIFEVVKAASLLSGEYLIYITGSHKRFDRFDELKAVLPDNVILTGFLPEKDYQNRLAASDAIMVITTLEYTLTCGAYEAVSLGKPMILGNTKTIMEFFNKGAVYTSIYPVEMADQITKLFADIDSFNQQVLVLKEEMRLSWEKQFNEIKEVITQ